MSLLANNIGSTVSAIPDVQNGINAAVNGRPKLAAAVNFFDALGSYDSKRVSDCLADDVKWTGFPRPSHTMDKAGISNPTFWKGLKNYALTHVAVPFEAEGDRVVCHTDLKPDVVTPGGASIKNEFFWVVTLRLVGNQWKVCDVIEMMDNVLKFKWLATWAKEKEAAAAGQGSGSTPTPGPATPATRDELLAAANRFVAAMQTYNVETFTGVCHTNFVQKFFPYSLKIADRDRATCVAKLHDIWNVVDGIKIEILDGATLIDPTQNRVHMHCRAIAPGNGKFTGIHYRNEYTFVMDFAKENNEWKVLVWREFVDSAGLTTFFTTENKAMADRAWTAAHPDGK